MKASELRIYNLVQNEKGDVYRVETIIHEHNEKKIVAWNIKNPAFGIQNDRMQPITLTDEWLLKFGFETIRTNKDSGYKEFGLKKNGFYIMFSLQCNCYLECFVESIGIDIYYVHQLQNLYHALTGKELIIN